MATHNRENQQDAGSLKPGSSREDAAKVGGEGDFGVRESDTTGRNYTSANTKASDPGNSHPRAGEVSRESGVGAEDVGRGSGSGGDLDRDLIGFGAGGSGVSQAGPDRDAKPGPDDSDGTSRAFASGPPAENRQPPKQELGGGKGRIASTIDESGDVSTGRDAQGADAATNPSARGDDSFAGEISSGEAGGQENSPSDRG